MHILVIIAGLPENAGGAQVRALRHVRYLNTLPDTQATLLAWDNETHTGGKSSPSPEVIPLRLYFRSKNNLSLPFQAIFLALHLSECFVRIGWFLLRNRKRFDLLHAFGSLYWFNLVAVQLAAWLKIPAIIEMIGMGHDPLGLNKRFGRPGKQVVRHTSLRYRFFLTATAYVSKSDEISRSYRHSGLAQSRLYQIASAVDTQVFYPITNPAEKAMLRQKLGLSPAAALVVFTGRLSKEKGLHWLLPAFRQLLPAHPTAQLLLLGAALDHDQAYAQERQAEVRQWGLTDKITFAGRVENVAEYLRAADLFVMTAPSEGFSGSILEAMACALPIVAFDAPGISGTQINHQREGLLAPIGDVPALTQAMSSLLSDSSLAAQLGQAAFLRVEQEFTPETIGQQYQAMYKQVLAAYRNSRHNPLSAVTG